MIGRLWRVWSTGREINNHTYADFVFDVVAQQPKLAHLSAFDVLDAVVNDDAWIALGQPDIIAGSISADRGRSSLAGRNPGNSTKHSAGSQAGAARVVEVEQAAH